MRPIEGRYSAPERFLDLRESARHLCEQQGLAELTGNLRKRKDSTHHHPARFRFFVDDERMLAPGMQKRRDDMTGSRPLRGPADGSSPD
jgi:hypothetical protein